jgi:hypothetical protein
MLETFTAVVDALPAIVGKLWWLFGSVALALLVLAYCERDGGV